MLYSPSCLRGIFGVLLLWVVVGIILSKGGTELFAVIAFSGAPFGNHHISADERVFLVLQLRGIPTIPESLFAMPESSLRLRCQIVRGQEIGEAVNECLEVHKRIVPLS